MARLLVEIDENLKRELKARLARNGETLKAWLTRAATSYVGLAFSPPPARERATPAFTPAPSPPPRSREEARPLREEPPPAPPPRPPRRNDDYLD